MSPPAAPERQLLEHLVLAESCSSLVEHLSVHKISEVERNTLPGFASPQGAALTIHSFKLVPIQHGSKDAHSISIRDNVALSNLEEPGIQVIHFITATRVWIWNVPGNSMQQCPVWAFRRTDWIMRAVASSFYQSILWINKLNGPL